MMDVTRIHDLSTIAILSLSKAAEGNGPDMYQATWEPLTCAYRTSTKKVSDNPESTIITVESPLISMVPVPQTLSRKNGAPAPQLGLELCVDKPGHMINRRDSTVCFEFKKVLSCLFRRTDNKYTPLNTGVVEWTKIRICKGLRYGIADQDTVWLRLFYPNDQEVSHIWRSFIYEWTGPEVSGTNCLQLSKPSDLIMSEIAPS